MDFPLYNIFKKQAESEPTLTPDRKRKLIDLIKQLDKDGKDNLYMLIRYSAKRDNDEQVYGSKYQRKGVVFDLDLFPDELQRMIYLFVQKHISETTVPVAQTEIVFA